MYFVNLVPLIAVSIFPDDAALAAAVDSVPALIAGVQLSPSAVIFLSTGRERYRDVVAVSHGPHTPLIEFGGRAYVVYSSVHQRPHSYTFGVENCLENGTTNTSLKV